MQGCRQLASSLPLPFCVIHTNASSESESYTDGLYTADEIKSLCYLWMVFGFQTNVTNLKAKVFGLKTKFEFILNI